jgi:hypothetical protein
MKKITLLLLIALVHTSLNAQFRGEDFYKIRHSITGKYMTIDAENSNITSTDELPNNDNSQVFQVKSVGSSGYFNIASTVDGFDAIRANSINVFPTNTSTPTSATNNTRIFAIEADSENTMQEGYTLRYIHTPQTTTGRYMYDKGADILDITDGNYPDSDVIYTGGAEDKAKWIFESLTNPLSTREFDNSSIFIANPVADKLTIKGLDNKIQKIEIFNLIGKSLLQTNTVGLLSVNINANTLKSGVYLVRLYGATSTLTKKVIKK